MIKRTLLFSNPVYLSTRQKQLLIAYPDTEPTQSVPVEDIGFVVLEHRQITITNALLDKLIAHNVAVVNCDGRHMPVGLLMPLSGNTLQTKRFAFQLGASLPLKKRLWQQTIAAKIANQAGALARRGAPVAPLREWAKKVTSGDKLNHEARAAAYYWERLFSPRAFIRDPGGTPPNALLNYGYAILRALTARALVGSGLLPAVGIFHRNRYNPYCLADDIMEPYRPFVDEIVCRMVDADEEDIETLSPSIKQRLLGIVVTDVRIGGKQSPLMVAMSRTTHSLYACFAGMEKKILYPLYE